MKRTMLALMLLLPLPAMAQTTDERVFSLEAFHGSALCSNGVVNPGAEETCDDGNLLDGDGCSSTCQIEIAPAEICGNNVREGMEACDGTDLAGQTCITQGFDGGTLACSVACSFDTSACVTNPPPTTGVYDLLAQNLPPPGEFVIIPNTQINVLTGLNEFPFCAEIKCGNAWKAFILWSGMAFDATGGRWWSLAAGGHADYGGNEVYRFDFQTLSWTRQTQPSNLPTGICPQTPFIGPAAEHTYSGALYIPSTGDTLMISSTPYCRAGVANPDGVWVFHAATSTWEKVSFMNLSYPRAVYDAARNRVYVVGGSNKGTFFEIDVANNYAVTQGPYLGWTGDGGSFFVESTRDFYYTGSSGDAGLRRVHVALDGVLGPEQQMFGWSEIGGTKPSGLAYHAPSQSFILWNGTSTLWRYYPATDTIETLLTGGVVPTGNNGISVYSKWVYIPEVDAFVGITDARNGVYLYRLPSAIASNFNQRCVAPGVVFCDPLDDIPTESWWRKWRGVDGTARTDTVTKASGAGSLHFNYPGNSGASAAGQYVTNFSSDLKTTFGAGDTFYLQFRWRVSCDFIYLDCDPASPTFKTARRSFRSTSGQPTAFKLMILSTADPEPGVSADACTALEIVLNHGADHTLQAYQSCNWYSGFTANTGAIVFGSTQINRQPQGDFTCWWIPDPTVNRKADWGYTGPNCFYLDADEWMTLQTMIQIGDWQPERIGPKTSQIKVWAAHEGEPQQLVIDQMFYADAPVGDPSRNGGRAYGKVWLLPFMTAKDPAEAHPPGEIWFDELIVSRQFIGDT